MIHLLFALQIIIYVLCGVFRLCCCVLVLCTKPQENGQDLLVMLCMENYLVDGRPKTQGFMCCCLFL